MNNRPLKPKWGHILRYSLQLLLVASLFSACDKQTLAHSFRSMPNKGWRQNDTVEFHFNLTDSMIHANLFVELRHRHHFPYLTLPVALRVTSPDSLQIATDSLQLPVADTLGRWQGKGLCNLYQVNSGATPLSIGRAGTYRIQVWHLLTDTLLPEVNDIGIRLMRKE